MASWQGITHFIYVVVILLVLKCDGQITSSLQDEIKCTSDSITLSWTYTTTNEIVAVWQFGTSTIMTVPVGGSPIIESAYTSRATHGGNGALTLTGLTTGDSGTYSLSITYSAAPVSASDSVQVTVYDKIMQESTPQCGTDTVTCGSSSMSGVSYSWTVDGAAVSDTSWSISSRSGTKTYACTISGDRVTNCLDAGISTTQSASCTFTEETTSVHGTSPSNLDTTQAITQSSGGITSNTDVTLSSSEIVTMYSNTATTDVLSTTRRDLDVDDELLLVIVSSLVGGILFLVILTLILGFMIKKVRASKEHASDTQQREDTEDKGMERADNLRNHYKGNRQGPQRMDNYKPNDLHQ